MDPALNLGDIITADAKSAPDFNVMVGGSPCQDFSIAGKQGGAMWRCSDCGHEYNPLEAHYTKRDRCPKCGSKEIEKTRSSLIVEWLRFLYEKKPKLAVYENVKNLVGRRFRQTFDLFIRELEDYGYNIYWQVIDAKTQGIPQHRERVYCVIIRKDLDNGRFRFPEPIPLRRSLRDMCEKCVAEKYYLPDKKVTRIVETPQVAYCITSSYHKGISYDHYIKTHQRQLITEARQESNIGVIIYDDFNRRIKADQSCIGTVMPNFKSEALGNGTKLIETSPQSFRVRRLTPLECWRLMGFEDEDFYRAKTALNENLFKGNDRSGTQLYKQAGNSIVVDVLLHIFENLYDVMPYLFEDIKLGSFFSGIGAFEKAFTLLGENYYSQEYRNEQDDNIAGIIDPQGRTKKKCRINDVCPTLRGETHGNPPCVVYDQLKQIGYINDYNGDANRIYDGSIARALKAEAGGGGC